MAEKKSGMKSAPARDVEAYLTELPVAVRAALEKLRRTIKAAAPKATECISYRIPIFKHLGHLVGFAAFKNHCSFFVMSTAVVAAHRDELEPHDTAKGTIRFTVDEPLPASLVRKLVKARIAENEGVHRLRQERKRRPRRPVEKGKPRSNEISARSARKKNRKTTTESSSANKEH
jgi:uncharacterized protein YdhG (YjbR/CyaY superfamily)